MDFREMIEAGAEKTGTARKLAELLGVSERYVSSAKCGERGLPDSACLKLAQILGKDFGKVIAARNEWTAKTEEERNFWSPLARAAGIGGISILCVTSLMTAAPAEAAQDKALSNPLCVLCKMGKTILMARLRRIAVIVFGNRKAAFGSYYFADHTAHA